MAQELKKELKLFDVYAVATGAMFSSGFFLLPGLAATLTGPSVFLAYFISGIIVLPTMFAIAELSPALPRAGGTYYIIDRALGPLVGTIGGYGSWLALILKSAFALIGMGAYIAIFWEVNITAIAVVLSIAFGAINIIGARETALFQRILVSAIVVVMAFYIVQGVADVFSLGILDLHNDRFTPFFTDGARGLFATVGMVFVSYAGLTKVASIAEEVENPDRNIPLGMFLSIGTAIIVYTVGVFLMVAYLDPQVLRSDLTPVATAGQEFLTFLPGSIGLILVTIAAVAAFASTGNAGIMSASRYPFAMARDKLIHREFERIGSRGTPTIAIITTVILMIFILIAFNVAQVAKLASAFELLLFALLNLAVIIMRESKIESYAPSFKVPLYPWLPIIGLISSVYLIMEMGFIAVSFTLVVSAFAIGWYYYYVHQRVERKGAIFHIHERLGKRKDYGLEYEMRDILREKGLHEEDPYESVIGRSVFLDIDEHGWDYDKITKEVCSLLSEKLNVNADELYKDFSEKEYLATPLDNSSALSHTRIKDDIKSQLAIVRIKNGLPFNKADYKFPGQNTEDDEKLYAIFFMVSSEHHASRHLRYLAYIAERVDTDNFLPRWLAAEDKADLIQILLRDERFIKITLTKKNNTADWIGKKISEIDFYENSLVAILKRNGQIEIPHGHTVLQEGDELSIIGEKEGIDKIRLWEKEF